MSELNIPDTVVGVLWRRRWLPLAIVVLIIAAVGAWLSGAPRSYTATAELTATPVAALLPSTGNVNDLNATMAQIANSSSVLQDVHSRLRAVRSLAALRAEVQGSQVPGTDVIRIDVVDRDARTAAAIANTVAEVLPLHDPTAGLLQFRQTNAAVPPATYSSPNTKVLVLAGVALALVLGVGGALLYDRLLGTVDTPQQLGQLIGRDVLVVLPAPSDPDSVKAHDRRDAEALRSLRLGLGYCGPERATGPVVIAGAFRRRDCSAWIAGNLAVALASAGYRVLLARSEESSEDQTPGLYDVLRDEIALEDAAIPGLVPGVSLLGPGSWRASRDAGLVEQRFGKLMAGLYDRFDAVLVSARPVADELDTALMAATGTLVLVVAAGTVRPQALRPLLAQLRPAGVATVETVLVVRNRVVRLRRRHG
jgi:succinoglycan biosynthesis transport protein ExoP